MEGITERENIPEEEVSRLTDDFEKQLSKKPTLSNSSEILLDVARTEDARNPYPLIKLISTEFARRIGRHVFETRERAASAARTIQNELRSRGIDEKEIWNWTVLAERQFAMCVREADLDEQRKQKEDVDHQRHENYMKNLPEKGIPEDTLKKRWWQQ